jgi:dTDP-4-dehydrorhamnose reductase
VLVVGAAGQLGQAMVARLGEQWPIVGVTRDALDLTAVDAVRRYVSDLQPAVVVNCAGYNDVDGAEDDQVTALQTNAIAVLTLARATADVHATLVHYSSDFVFDGETDRPYREDDRPNPRSVYAASKLIGEWFAADVQRHYVLRVESLFGGVSRLKSSLDRIVEAVAAGGPVRVFVDRIVSPSYAWDVADATAAILGGTAASGVYHCVNSGAASWHDVAVEAQRLLGSPARLEPVRMADVALRAPRPRYCALANDKLHAAGFAMPTWQDALGRYVKSRTPGAAAAGPQARRP